MKTVKTLDNVVETKSFSTSNMMVPLKDRFDKKLWDRLILRSAVNVVDKMGTTMTEAIQQASVKVTKSFKPLNDLVKILGLPGK